MAKKIQINEELRKTWEQTIRAAVHPNDMPTMDWDAVIPQPSDEPGDKEPPPSRGKVAPEVTEWTFTGQPDEPPKPRDKTKAPVPEVTEETFPDRQEPVDESKIKE